MSLYRKKPVIVEADRWLAHVAGREDTIIRYFRRPDISGDVVCGHCEASYHEHGWIDTLEGGHTVCPGDWVIRGVEGEYYACKPSIFAETYEAVE